MAKSQVKIKAVDGPHPEYLDPSWSSTGIPAVEYLDPSMSGSKGGTTEPAHRAQDDGGDGVCESAGLPQSIKCTSMPDMALHPTPLNRRFSGSFACKPCQLAVLYNPAVSRTLGIHPSVGSSCPLYARSPTPWLRQQRPRSKISPSMLLREQIKLFAMCRRLLPPMARLPSHRQI